MCMGRSAGQREGERDVSDCACVCPRERSCGGGIQREIFKDREVCKERDGGDPQPVQLSLCHPSPHHSQPLFQAFCSSNQLPSCCSLSQRWRIVRGGSCGCLQYAVILQYIGCSRRRKAIVSVQSQDSTSQPTSDRRTSRGTKVQRMEKEEVLLVEGRSTIGPKSRMAIVAAPPPFPPPRHQFGSPLLWIGLGVGISVISWAAMRNKSYFPFWQPFLSPSPTKSSMTIASAVRPLPIEMKEAMGKTEESKEAAFSDANTEPLTDQNHSESRITSEKLQEETSVQVSGDRFGDQNINAGSSSTSNDESFTSMEMLERMIDGPQIQKMFFPYLPEQLRDPVTIKRMIRLRPVQQQLQEALNNIGGEGLHKFTNMNSDLVKQQFGLTPEESVGKILANPDIAASLQNSKVVAAIMDCSQNPLNITKYQNDEEVMNTLLKAAELFHGATKFSC